MTQMIAATAVSTAGTKLGLAIHVRSRRMTSRPIILLNAIGFVLNWIQLCLSSSRRNASWVTSRSNRKPVSMMVGWYWCIAEPFVCRHTSGVSVLDSAAGSLYCFVTKTSEKVTLRESRQSGIVMRYRAVRMLRADRCRGGRPWPPRFALLDLIKKFRCARAINTLQNSILL